MQNLSDIKTRAKLQRNFIQFVLVPWWKAMARLFPSMKRCYMSLLVNERFYSSVGEGETSDQVCVAGRNRYSHAC